MSGFLQRLAARAVGSPAIVPRAAALFEPPPVVPVAAVQTLDADAARIPAVPRKTLDVADARAPNKHDGGPPPKARAAEPAPLPSAPRRRGDTDSLASRAHPHTVQPVGRSTVPETTEVAAPRAEEPTPHERLAMPARSAPPAAAIPARRAPPAAAIPALVTMHALPVPRTSATPQSPVAPRARGTESAEPVRVTIGRVEVRAVFPAPPSRPGARAAPPSPSLEDYLRKRGRA